MKLYSLKYKRSNQWLWRSFKNLTGQFYDKDTDQMTFSFKDGSLQVMAEWSKYNVRMGRDFIEFTEACKKEAQG